MMERLACFGDNLDFIPKLSQMWGFNNKDRSKTRCSCSVAQSGPTLCDPMDCSSSGSSVHGIFWARILEWVGLEWVLHQGTLPTQGSKPNLLCLLHCQADTLTRCHVGSPSKTYKSDKMIEHWKITEMGRQLQGNCNGREMADHGIKSSHKLCIHFAAVTLLISVKVI